MIASLRGTVAAVSLDSVVLDVGGVGYLTRCTPGTIAGLRIGQEAQLATTLVVREDSMTVYGFADATERDMFELVQTASGVGPKVALAMLAVLDPDRLRQAIAQADHSTLMSVPGIGRKGAERIVVELKDRVGLAGSAAPTGAPAWREQVHEALLGLGWPARDAERAVDNVAADLADDPGAAADVSTLLRDALRSLARTR
ncbi:Holliday junction DNA helicase RuvA [Aeromicrobium marinum DSM 15272]|uniref:Holliday junction branch migration complex subunit RuvA n=1 Tax=Aeromicrobium marinum DSM 15272 TaxID=585531 RepID=E2S9E2_9ACTN|nr:Holliday junction branch migration protein RuvA [Aeromicrobium marinum]EFQ83866.1 Holliday junction DNA helicase RuvA [Aeromicrobium marinum DSM 15272]